MDGGAWDGKIDWLERDLRADDERRRLQYIHSKDVVEGGVLNDVSNVLFYIIIIITIAIQRISRNLTAFLPGRILAEE